jgi:hypothetical protein
VLAHDRSDAVGADHRVAFDPFAVREGHPPVVDRAYGDAVAHCHPLGEHRLQGGALDDQHRRPLAVPQRLDVDLRQRAAASATEHRTAGRRGDGAHRPTPAECIQRVDRVRPEDQPRADRGAGRRALKHHRLVASQCGGPRGAQAADPGANDHDSRHASQHKLEPAQLRPVR